MALGSLRVKGWGLLGLSGCQQPQARLLSERLRLHYVALGNKSQVLVEGGWKSERPKPCVRLSVVCTFIGSQHSQAVGLGIPTPETLSPNIVENKVIYFAWWLPKPLGSNYFHSQNNDLGGAEAKVAGKAEPFDLLFCAAWVKFLSKYQWLNCSSSFLF